MQPRLINVGDFLERLRASRGLSLHELSELSQLSLGMLERMEIGAEQVALTNLHAVLKALQVTEEEYLELMQIVAADRSARLAR